MVRRQNPGFGIARSTRARNDCEGYPDLLFVVFCTNSVLRLLTDVLFLVVAMALGGVEGRWRAAGALWLWLSSGTGWMVLVSGLVMNGLRCRSGETPMAWLRSRRRAGAAALV